MTFLIIVITLVLLFDFINGFHDSANSITTVVSAKVLSPLAAVSIMGRYRKHFLVLDTYYTSIGPCRHPYFYYPILSLIV